MIALKGAQNGMIFLYYWTAPHFAYLDLAHIASRDHY